VGQTLPPWRYFENGTGRTRRIEGVLLPILLLEVVLQHLATPRKRSLSSMCLNWGTTSRAQRDPFSVGCRRKRHVAQGKWLNLQSRSGPLRMAAEGERQTCSTRKSLSILGGHCRSSFPVSLPDALYLFGVEGVGFRV